MLSGGRAVAGILLLAVCLASSATASARVPNPLEPGPLGVNELEYQAGEIALTIPQEDEPDASFTQPLEGSVTFPSGPGPWPVVLFLHGRHTTCITADGAEVIPDDEDDDVTDVQCPDAFAPDGQQLQTRIRSYAGYGYLATLLASHGYAVVSPSANVIASFDGGEDGGAAARAQVIGATLDLMRRWNNGAGPDPIGTRLTGRLELQRVGLMGHSRGGEGVTQYIAFNAERAIGYPLNGVIALAPTDFSGADPFRNGATNLAEVLPACDGDVFDLEGGHVFERVKYSPQGAPFTKLQWFVQGANHNYFNTVWTDDDAQQNPVTGLDAACDPTSPTTVRLDPADQRRVGIALMASFVRHFEGGEEGFGPIVTGNAYPRPACPRGPSVPCDALVRTSHIAPRRRTVIEPGGTQPLQENALGGAIRANRLSLGLCDPTEPDPVLGGPPLIACPGPVLGMDDPSDDDTSDDEPQFINRSWTPQLVATWARESSLTTEIPRPFRNVRGFQELTFRSVTTLSESNPAAVDNDAGPATQRYDVVLVDRRGGRDRVRAERFSAALQPALGDAMRQLILSDVRIPLRRFDGVDTRRLRKVKLRFGVRGRAAGQVQISDLAFQGGGGGSRAVATGAGEVRRGPGTAVDAIALDAVTDPVGPAGCGDRTAPSLEVKRPPIVSTGRLAVSGTATDVGCSGLARVQVAVVDPVEHGCRFLGSDGALGPVTGCAHPYALIAPGPRRWSLGLDALGLPGDAEAVIWAIDRAGNVSAGRRLPVAGTPGPPASG